MSVVAVLMSVMAAFVLLAPVAMVAVLVSGAPTMRRVRSLSDSRVSQHDARLVSTSVASTP